MLYETSLNTTVKVKDGPTVSDKYTDPEVTAIYEKKIIFPASEQNQTGRFEWSCPQCFAAEGIGAGSRLAFLSIQATRYNFDDCGEKKPGVAVILPGCAGQTAEKFLLESGRVFVDQPGADLKKFDQFQLSVNTELFTCPKGNDDILITIAYAVKSPKTPPPYLASLELDLTKCKKPMPSSSASGNGEEVSKQLDDLYKVIECLRADVKNLKKDSHPAHVDGNTAPDQLEPSK